MCVTREGEKTTSSPFHMTRFSKHHLLSNAHPKQHKLTQIMKGMQSRGQFPELGMSFMKKVSVVRKKTMAQDKQNSWWVIDFPQETILPRYRGLGDHQRFERRLALKIREFQTHHKVDLKTRCVPEQDFALCFYTWYTFLFHCLSLDFYSSGQLLSPLKILLLLTADSD